MELRILGPLEARDDERVLPIRGGKQRALLARLALEPNRVVAVETLVDDLWGEAPPETATKMIQIYVSHLRKALPPETLRTRPPGYALELGPGALDLERFERLLAEGRELLAAGRAAEAEERFSEALGLWRGPALSEFAEPFAQGEAARLAELRLVATEERIEAELALGRHADAAGELESLTARHPLRERLRAQRMLALYRLGRQAEALDVYKAYRTALDEELGIEPSARLRELERQVLRQAPELELEPHARPTATGPEQLETRYARSGDVSIAYQVVSEGAVDLVLVHGWICTFQPGWENPKIAAFYRRLASMGRLILFDKRGTGLSDRVPLDRLADLETRMDDVRAVMDAVGSERAVLLGISEGGPMSALFAATYPERTAALCLLGTFARWTWAPDYPLGMTAEQWQARLEARSREDWGHSVALEWLRRTAPAAARDPAALRWYASYLARGASPGAERAISLMNQEIDVRHILPAIRAPTLALYRENEYQAARTRYMGERIPGAQIVAVPGNDHLPWEGDQDDLLSELERFLARLEHGVETDRVLVTLLLGDGAADAGTFLGEAAVDAALARHRGRRASAAGNRLVATFDGPARAIRCASAIAAAARRRGIALRQGLHTGEVELAGGVPKGVALDIAAGVASAAAPGEVLVSQTVKDLVAGSGIEFEDRGGRALEGVPGEWRLLAVRSNGAAPR